MSKKVIVDAVAEKLDVKKVEAEKFVDTVLDVLFESITNNEDTLISGFGKFSIVNKAARVGRNPRTGEEVKIEAKKGIKFKASEAMKSAVN